MAENAVKLCEAERAFIFRFDGQLLRAGRRSTPPPNSERSSRRIPSRPGAIPARRSAALERRTIHIHDVLADPEYTDGAMLVDSIRTVLGIPMLRAGELLGRDHRSGATRFGRSPPGRSP